MAVAVGPPRR